MKTLTAFCDFAVTPVSFDFIKFLVAAEFERKAIKADRVRIVFVPAPTGDGWRDDRKPITTQEKIWRFDHLVLPACKLIEAKVCVLEHRVQAENEFERAAHPWPLDYHPLRPTAGYLYNTLVAEHQNHKPPHFPVNRRAYELVKHWRRGLNAKKFVTITHRTTYHEPRNSAHTNWLRFARRLGGQGWGVVEIPDTSEAGTWHDPLGAVAAVDLLVRHALYDAAWQNMGVDNGPFALCQFSDLPYLVTVFQRDHKNTSEEFYRKNGLEPGGQHIWPGPRRKLVWCEDSFENLCDMFQRESDAGAIGDDRGLQRAITNEGAHDGQETEARQEKAEVTRTAPGEQKAASGMPPSFPALQV